MSTVGDSQHTREPDGTLAAGSVCDASHVPATACRVTHPHFADPAEWDYDTNDVAGFTPDNQLSGSKQPVSWLCERHGAYKKPIQERATAGQGCVACGDEERERKRRDTLNAKRRARYRPAKPDR